jgi:peptidoglycan/LPS O-acetylase OafA/YrhL
VLLVGAMLAARFVPGFVIDVPDQYLLDLERLAVTAWSARDRPSGRRGRTLVSRAAVAAVAARGTRMLTAYCVAVLVVAAIAAPLLLQSTPLAIDRIGARCLVFFSGCGLLLAARSYRHAAARGLLRAAGLICLGVLVAAAVRTSGDGRMAALGGAAILLAAVLIVAAVATGRGWRSAWWSRRAEVAEALCGSAAVASVLVASGVFRSLWESIHIQV